MFTVCALLIEAIFHLNIPGLLYIGLLIIDYKIVEEVSDYTKRREN